MEITQTSIKMNQNSNLEKGNGKNPSTTANIPIISFDQILALFNVGRTSDMSDQPASLQKLNAVSGGGSKLIPKFDQLSNIEGTDPGSPLSLLDQLAEVRSLINTVLLSDQEDKGNNPITTITEIDGGINGNTPFSLFSLLNQDVSEGEKSVPIGNENRIQPENLTINKQDWQELDNILAALFAGIQQIQNAPTVPQEKLNFSTSSVNEELENQLSSDQAANPQLTRQLNELQVSLSKWFEKVSNQNQSSVDLGNLIQQGSSQMNQIIESDSMPVIQKDILQKLQSIIEQSNIALSDAPLSSVEPIMISNEAAKMPLSLDKDQMILETNSLTNVNQSIQNMTQTDFPDGAASAPVLPVSQFAPEMSEWISKFVRINDGPVGSTEAKFSLYPEHLGHIEVKITSQDGVVTAEIITNNSMAKDALEGQLQQLKQSLQQQGISLQKIDIVQTQSMTANQSSLNLAQNGQFSSQREQRTYTPGQEGSKRKKDSEQTEIEFNPIPGPYGGASYRKDSVLDFTV